MPLSLIHVIFRYHIEVKQTNGVLEKVNEIYDQYCLQISETYKKLQDINYLSEELDSLDKLSDFNTRQKWQLLVHQENHGASTVSISGIASGI